MPAAVASGKTGMSGLLKNQTLSYSSNLVGSLFVAGIMFDKAADWTMPMANYAVAMANTKCNLSFEVAFIRGIGCNWLVCQAIFMALTMPDGVPRPSSSGRRHFRPWALSTASPT